MLHQRKYLNSLILLDRSPEKNMFQCCQLNLFIGRKYFLTKALNGKFIIKVSIGALPQELRGVCVGGGGEGGEVRTNLSYNLINRTYKYGIDDHIELIM